MKYILLQLTLFTPFFLVWVNDVRIIGRENLAVSLKLRFLAWVVACPIWILAFIK